MSKKPSFSLFGFKKWISEQKDLSEFFDVDDVDSGIIGESINSRVSPKKLMIKSKPGEGELEDLVEEFANDGGIVLESNEKYFLVEVSSGNFYVPKFYVKLSQKEND
jgi:hypothetical protein